MTPLISLERRDAILALANKRAEIVCKLTDGNHVDGLEEVLRLVDRPVVTREELIHEPEYRIVAQLNKWYDLLANACRWVQNIGLTMTDHVPVYWFDEQEQSIQWTYADELVFAIDEQDVPYEGQQLFASAIDYYGIVTAEELKTAILECEVEEAERLMEMIKQAMKEYI